MFDLFKRLTTQKGNAIMNVVVASAAVGVGALLLTKTGEMRGSVALDMNQNSMIENIMLDMKVSLTDSAVCNPAFLAQVENNDMLSIGNYSVGNNDLGLGVRLERLQQIEKIAGRDPADPRILKLIAVFDKERADVGGDGQKKSSKRTDFLYIQTFTAPDGQRFCSTIETAGIDNSFKAFCALVTGDINNYDDNTGQCNTTQFTPGNMFTDAAYQAACEALGGSFNGNRCNQIDLRNSAAEIESSHFKSTNPNARVDLGANGSQTAHPSFSCPLGQVAKNIETNGELNCEPLVCPNPPPSVASTYIFDNTTYTNEVVCKCQKDNPRYTALPRDDGNNLRTTGLACGATDNNYCEDYIVDDGCNPASSPTQCIIYGGKTADCSCAATTLVGETCQDPNCGVSCAGTMAPTAGACGSAAGVATNTQPNSNLCAEGSVTLIGGSCPTGWNWTCTNDGVGAACSAPCEDSGIQPGVCGNIAGGVCNSMPSADLCETSWGNSGVTENPGNYEWGCYSSQGGPLGLQTYCSCAKPSSCICGNANGNTYDNPEDVNIAGLCGNGCTTSTPPLNDQESWNWTCTQNGFQDSPNCNAMCTGGRVDGDCGPWDGTGPLPNPVIGTGDVASLCDAGTPTMPFYTAQNERQWSCLGSCGGGDRTCTVAPSCADPAYFYDTSKNACRSTIENPATNCAPAVTWTHRNTCMDRVAGTCEGTTAPIWTKVKVDGAACNKQGMGGGTLGGAGYCVSIMSTFPAQSLCLAEVPVVPGPGPQGFLSCAMLATEWEQGQCQGSDGNCWHTTTQAEWHNGRLLECSSGGSSCSFWRCNDN